jgi:hypothetical protein
MLQRMSSGYKIHEKDGAHFLTFQVVGWVDLFARRDYREVVLLRNRKITCTQALGTTQV